MKPGAQKRKLRDVIRHAFNPGDNARPSVQRIGSADLNVGQLKKQLERVPDDASVCMTVLGYCIAPRRVIWCVKDNGVIITSD